QTVGGGQVLAVAEDGAQPARRRPARGRPPDQAPGQDVALQPSVKPPAGRRVLMAVADEGPKPRGPVAAPFVHRSLSPKGTLPETARGHNRSVTAVTDGRGGRGHLGLRSGGSTRRRHGEEIWPTICMVKSTRPPATSFWAR